MTSPTVVDIPFGIGPVLPLNVQYLLFATGVLFVALVAWHTHVLRRLAAGRSDTDAGVAVAAAWAIALVAGTTGVWISVFGAWVLGGGVGLVIGLGHLSGRSAARICGLTSIVVVLAVGGVSPTASVADATLWALVHVVPSLLFAALSAGLAWTTREFVAVTRRPRPQSRVAPVRPAGSRLT